MQDLREREKERGEQIKQDQRERGRAGGKRSCCRSSARSICVVRACVLARVFMCVRVRVGVGVGVRARGGGEQTK